MRYEELEKIVSDEITQRGEEGCDVTEAKEALARMKRKVPSRLDKILRDLSKLSPMADFPYKEPSDLPGIRAERSQGPRKLSMKISEDQIFDKIYGGWLGRCAGCLLGKPAEGLGKEQIEEWLGTVDAYPLSDYFPPLPELPEEAPEWLRRRSSRLRVLKGHIDRMVRDDDIDYTILNLDLLESRGFKFTAADVGNAWLSKLPYLMVYTAERVAYRNLVNGLVPPETATRLNPYREWIGAQIRADMWGYVTPGMPELGAELAYGDASLSHVKNGTYGEMFVSAMISAAFATNSIEDVVNIGLSEIPSKSRLAEAVRDVMAWRRKYSDWRGAWSRINEKYGHYHGVHTINNAAVVVLSLLYGDGDYKRSISTSVMGGWDTDCNGATTGSILGVILGAQNLPEKWIKPLNDRTESSVIGYDNSQISDLARRTFRMAEKALKGEIE